MEEEIYILGTTLLESPVGPQCNRCDARDEKSLRQPSRLPRRVWDEHEQQEFDLQALLFVTINDWPALSNLSGQTNKGYNACTHCLNETESIRLDKCKKNVYPGHQRWLPDRHALRKKGKHFNGLVEKRPKLIPRSGVFFRC